MYTFLQIVFEVKVNKKLGAILLIAGCSIGAGMLGLPVMTGASGFIPSTAMFFVVWLFMMTTGIVLAELTLSFEGKGVEVNLISMAEHCLGSVGKWVTWILFSFLFYTIMVAYSIGGGVLIVEFVQFLTNIHVPFSLASGFLVAVLFLAIICSDGAVDLLNRVFMIGLLVAYVLLILVGIKHVQGERLLRSDWSASFLSLPILVVSFGFHNLVPSLSRYLNFKDKPLKKAIVVGSFLPLLVYLAWEFVILGIVPFSTAHEWHEVKNHGELINQVLMRAYGSDSIVHLSSMFAFFAIGTSFLPVAFSFVDFVQDGLKVKKTKIHRAILALVVLIPPYLLALGDATLFIKALNFAGGVCATLLFGFLPALMAFKRFQGGGYTPSFSKKGVLILLMIASLCILGVELFDILVKKEVVP